MQLREIREYLECFGGTNDKKTYKIVSVVLFLAKDEILVDGSAEKERSQDHKKWMALMVPKISIDNSKPEKI